MSGKGRRVDYCIALGAIFYHFFLLELLASLQPLALRRLSMSVLAPSGWAWPWVGGNKPGICVLLVDARDWLNVLLSLVRLAGPKTTAYLERN